MQTATLPDEVATRLDDISRLTGVSKNQIIVEAIQGYLDDLEDYCIAPERIADIRAGREKNIPLEEVEAMLDLEN